MSTRCRIGLVNPDGTVEHIHCQIGGNPREIGNTLQEHYRDEPRLREIIALGNLTSLGASPEPPEDPDSAEHPFTWARHRDAGWGWVQCQPITGQDRDAMREFLMNPWIEHLYAWDQGTWMTASQVEPEWHRLEIP